MEPRRGAIVPELDRWRRDARHGDRRTVIVRFRGGADPARAAARLTAIGVEVVSSGPGSAVGVVSPPVLERIGQEDWVLAVEPPRTLRSLSDD